MLAGAFLVVATAVAYSPVLSAGFVWDDDVYVTANPLLDDAAGLRAIWTRPGATPQYYPLLFSTLWAAHRVWGVEPLGYHMLNLTLHAAAALLLWAALRRLRVPGAWLAAALFALHPVNVESVAWVSELKNVLSAVLYLLSFLAYLRAAPPDTDATAAPPRRGCHGAALLLFAAALLTKPAAIGLPLVILLVVWWKRGSVRGRDLLRVAPMLALAAAMSWVTVTAERLFSGASGAAWHLSVAERALIAGRALWFYAGKLVWPVPLIAVYPRWPVSATALWQWLFPLAAVAVAATLWWQRSRLGRGPAAAAAAFAVLLAPTLGFLDVAYFFYAYVADHFAYHAAPALLALLAAAVAVGRRRLGRGGAARVADVGVAAVLVVLAGLTWRHAQAFADERTLCLDTLARNPDAWLAMNNLGVALANEGRPAEAVALYERALALAPEYAEAHNNLGVALVALGRTDEAIAHYREAVRIWPRFPRAYGNLGAALAMVGRTDEGIDRLEEAIRQDPDYAEAHRNLGAALAARGDHAGALRQRREAVRARPDSATARNDLGVALAAAGQPAEAAAELREALRLKPDYAEAHNNLALALAALGDAAGGEREYREALRLKPDYAEAHLNLGAALGAAGREEEAVEEYRAALRLRPDWAEAHNNLGVALVALGRDGEALACFREAVRRKPGAAEAHKNLGLLLLSLGQVGDAIAAFHDAVRLDPALAEAHAGLGAALATAGRLEEAVTEFERTLELRPADAAARANLERARALLSAGASPR